MTDYSDYKEKLFAFNSNEELKEVFTTLLDNANSFGEKISVVGVGGTQSGDVDQIELADSLSELQERILRALDVGLSILDSTTTEIQYKNLLKLMGSLSEINLSSRTSKSVSQKKNNTDFEELLNSNMELLTKTDELLEGTLVDVRVWNKERGEYSRTHYVRAPYVAKKKPAKTKKDSKVEPIS